VLTVYEQKPILNLFNVYTLQMYQKLIDLFQTLSQHIFSKQKKRKKKVLQIEEMTYENGEKNERLK
jgi:hypothetical protein